jgi:two-component system OmpR family response regulator
LKKNRKESEKPADTSPRPPQHRREAEDSMTDILLIDDDSELSEMLTEYLAGEGFETTTIFNGVDGAAAALDKRYSAVILDVMLPGISGTEVLRRIRQASSVPVIMLTAKGSDIDRVVGLEMGADDYIAKPYYPRELVARLRAVLRRQAQDGARTKAESHAELYFSKTRREVRWNAQPVDLTATEFNMLEALLRSGETVATKEELSRSVLGRAHEAYDRSVDVHVGNLRRKLLAASGGELEIETVRGVGYRLRPQP